MSHVFQLSDEQYATLAAYAARQALTPETLFQKWVNEVTHNTDTSSSPSSPKLANQSGQVSHEKETLSHPLLHVAGIFAIDEPHWADNHDEYLAEAYGDDHANNS